jgi:light-regulated signal transduction histidine kinase (bacteriophytochrome)
MVTSYTNLLSKRYGHQLDSDAHEFMSFSIDGAKRMSVLINDLLTYSRVGTKGKQFTTVDADAILRNTVSVLQVAIGECGAVVTHDKLPIVRGDDVQLGQLLQNLIGNGIKYRNGNAPKVHISCRPNGDQWLFSVEDNGIGIDPKFADKIFVIFQRLHTKEAYPGTGIGLAVCKKIVERHGGKIWVESQPSVGSTFYFTIPMTGTTEPSHSKDEPLPKYAPEADLSLR